MFVVLSIICIGYDKILVPKSNADIWEHDDIA